MRKVLLHNETNFSPKRVISENSNPEKKRQKYHIKQVLIGSYFAIGLFIALLIEVESFRPLWYLMVVGVSIGLISGSLIGVMWARVYMAAKKPKRPRLIFAIFATLLMGNIFIALFSYLSWQESYIQTQIFLPLINATFGLMIGFFLIGALAQRYMSDRL
jgi:hypothetical protein